MLQIGSVERPEPKPGEVRVRVHASGVNPSDTYGRRGGAGADGLSAGDPAPGRRGRDRGGRRGRADAERVGERVWVYEATWNRPGGTAAEYTRRARRSARCALPDAIDFDAGACLGIPALTAHRAVFADGPVTRPGGAGHRRRGRGRHAPPSNSRNGAARTVLATVSSDAKAAAAASAGADHTINYKTQDVVAEVQRLTDDAGVERIVEVDFGGNLPTSLQIVKPHGTIASYATRGDPEPKVPFRALMVKNITVHAILVYTMPESAKAGRRRPTSPAPWKRARCDRCIGARLPLERIAEAHAAVERGTIIGNVVLHYG